MGFKEKTIDDLLGTIFQGILVMKNNECKVIRKSKEGNTYDVCTLPKEDSSETSVYELPVEETINSIEEFTEYKPVYTYSTEGKTLYDYCEYVNVLGRKVHFTDPFSMNRNNY